MAIADDFLNQQIDRDIALERYKRGQVLRVLEMLARVEEDIVEQINRLDPNSVRQSYRQARLARLLAAVQERIDQYGEMLEKELIPEFQQLAVDEGKFGVHLLNDLPPVALDVITPAATALKAAATARPFQGRLLREWVSEHPAAVRMRLRNAIRQGVAQGETVAQIVQRVRGTRAAGFKDGVMEINRRGAEAMVRTAVSHTVNAARTETYQSNADIVKGVQWVATLDSRTSQTCISLDGKVFPISSGPRPPAHINCRSSTIPVLKSWKELGIPLGESPVGTRASMDGQVAGDMRYADWLKGKSREFQDEVLGKTRADLWRSGEVPMDKFVDYSGRAYTLDQLRKRYPQAFGG